MAGIAAFARRYRRWLIAFGAVVVVVAAVAISLPFGVRYALADWLRGDGARVASVERVVIDYLEPSIEIVGVRVEDKDGKVLHFGRIAVALDPGSLWNRRLHLRSLALEGGTVELTQNRDGDIRVAGIPIGPASPEEPSESTPWLVGIDSTAINGLQIRVHTPDGSQDFTIERARLGSVAMWAEDATTALQLAVALGDGSMTVGGEAKPLGTAPTVAIDLDVKALDLARARFVPGLADLSGRLAGRLKLTAAFPRDKSPEIHIGGNASLEGLNLKGQPGAPSLASLAWTGDASLATNPKGALVARIQGQLALGKLTSGKNSLASARFSNLDARVSYDAASGVDANVSGRLEAVAPHLDLDDAQGTAERVRWNGTAHLVSSPRDLRIEAKGDLVADAPSFTSEGATPAERSQASLANVAFNGLDANVTRNAAGALRIDARGTLTAGDAKAQVRSDSYSNGSLSWNGTVSVTMEPGHETQVALDGTMDSTKLALDLKSLGYAATQNETHWQGTAKLVGGAPTMSASIRTTGTTVESAEPSLRLLDVGHLALDEAEMGTDGRLSVKTARAEALRAFGPRGATNPTDFIAAVSSLAAEGIGFAPGERIAARQVKIDDAEVELERDKEGKLRLTGILAALGGDAGPGDAGKSARIVVDDLVLGGKSRIQFVDRSVDPPTKIAFGPVRLHLGELDSAKADRPVPIDLAADVGNYAKLDLKGSAKPFAERINVDVEGKLTGFELTSLSGYLSQYLGYNLSRGRLDTDVHVKIVDGALDSSSQLTITNLAVAQGKSDASRALQRNLEISLETALSLLRNSDDVIELKVPVTGDISSPNFDLSDAINTAIGNAMKRTVTTMLTVAFPVGGLIMAIVDATGDKALMFKPVLFEGGEVTLDAAAREYLDTIGKLMAARPGVRITACGVSTQRDAADIFRVRQEKATAENRKLTALAGKAPPKPDEAVPVTRDDLYDLSHRRSVAVKDYLIARPGVAEMRVFICAPNIADDPAAAPHAEITL